MPVSEQFLDLADINAGVEQQGSGSSAERVGAEYPHAFLNRTGQPGQIIGDDPVHAGLAHGVFAELVDTRRPARAEKRPAFELGLPDVLGNSLGGGEMDADGAVVVAFFTYGEGGFFAILVKVLDPEPAGSGEPYAGVEISLEDGAVAIVEHAVASGKAHELPRACRAERARAFQRIGRFAGDELRVSRIGDVDGQPQLGRGCRPGTYRSWRARKCGG
jgi:hypothetical protein